MELIELPATISITDIGLEIDPATTPEHFKQVGLHLARSARSFGWWIGDWFNHGVKHFKVDGNEGCMRAIIESPDWSGPAYQTCANLGMMAAAFPVSRRRETLSVSHHLVVVPLLREQQDQLLDRAERESASRRTLQKWVSAMLHPPVPVPESVDVDRLSGYFDHLTERMSATSKRRAQEILRMDPETALRVAKGDLTLWKGHAMAKAIYNSKRAVAVKRRIAAVAAEPVQPTVIGSAPEYMALQLRRAVQILAELNVSHVGIHLLRQELQLSDRRFMDNQLGNARRYLKRVEDAFAAKVGDINDDDERATA